MRKLIFVAFALILIGAGCGKQTTSANTSSAPPTAEDGQEELFSDCVKEKQKNNKLSIPAYIINDICYQEQAVNRKDVSYCEKISLTSRTDEGFFSADYYTTCLFNVALKSKNKEICNKIPNQEDREVCINGVARESDEPLFSE